MAKEEMDYDHQYISKLSERFQSKIMSELDHKWEKVADDILDWKEGDGEGNYIKGSKKWLEGNIIIEGGGTPEKEVNSNHGENERWTNE